MSVTISFSLADGVVLPRDAGRRLAARAATVVEEIARNAGWTYLGPVDTEPAAHASVWSSPPIEGHCWRVSGSARFTLATVAGSGQLAETRVRTSFADDPVAAHRSVLSVLNRLNRDVYAGRIVIVDDTAFADPDDENALAEAFAANARLVTRVIHTLTGDGSTAEQDHGEADADVTLMTFVGTDCFLPNEVIDGTIQNVGFPAQGGNGDRRRAPTLLDQFLKARGVDPAHLARESGYSRQFLLKVRMGRIIPSLRCMGAIVAALVRITRGRLAAHQLLTPELLTAAQKSQLLPPAEGAER
jgi:hypothetical protein